jgi:hypothetical protein
VVELSFFYVSFERVVLSNSTSFQTTLQFQLFIDDQVKLLQIMQIDQVVMRLKVPKFLWQIDENDAMRLASLVWWCTWCLCQKICLNV